MSKRKPTADPISIVAALAILALGGAVLLVPYVWTVTFYSFPAFLIYLLANSTWKPRPTLLAITAEHMRAARDALEANRDRLVQEIATAKDRGKREGVRYLHREDRFESRSGRGQELNQDLEWAKSQLSDVQEQISIARTPNGLRFFTWADALGTWYRGRSFQFAFIVALLTLVIGIGWDFHTYAYRYEFTHVLIWNPAPTLIRTGTVVGAQLGWLTGWLTRSFLLRYYQSTAAGRSEEQYLQEAYSAANDYEEAESGGEETSGFTAQAVYDPYAILNVSRDASIEALKSAYRDSMKRCHPDTVADRSEIIKNAAEAEAQQINSAYEMIRNERGFK